jgi:hypothetical protein
MAKRISIHDQFRALRKERIRLVGASIPKSLQGVSKSRVEQVLSKIALKTDDRVCCVFALLDNITESFKGFKFSDGATTAQLGCHIAFLQRDNDIKLDREGRDYWIKPLREIGAIEEVTLFDGEFVSGHVKPKSPNSSYRLNKEFVSILQAPKDSWERELSRWNSKDATRRRMEMQARAAEESKKAVDTGHEQLINLSISIYAKNFLPSFSVLYIDDSDGRRISPEYAERLARAGVSIGLEDAFPDVLLWNSEREELWCIEAVTSDGEVDSHKVEQLRKMAKRCLKKNVGFTTTYLNWKTAASRQDANRNLAVGSFVWIASDPSRQFEVSTFEDFVSRRDIPDQNG